MEVVKKKEETIFPQIELVVVEKILKNKKNKKRTFQDFHPRVEVVNLTKQKRKPI